MGITAFSGPTVTFGLTRTSTGGVQEYNEQRAPDLSDGGFALYDPRPPYGYAPGSPVSDKVWGWFDAHGVISAKPGTFTAATIAATQVPVSGTALTLSTGSSGCVTTGVTLVPASNPNTTVTVLAIDSTYSSVPRGLACGEAGTVSLWDPSLAVSRCITMTKPSTQDDTAATYTIQGYDIYGYKVTETITGTSSQGSSLYTSRKAFKYIESITPAGTLGSTGISVYPSDTYGFPLAVRSAPQVELWMGVSSMIDRVGTQSSLFTFGSTVTQTATTPDVRGTWASTNLSSNSSNNIFVRVRPRAQDIQNMTSTYLSTGHWLWLGDSQYSS